MPNSGTIQRFYPPEFRHCYGCGQESEHGLRLESGWEGDDVVARFQPRAEHISVPGYVYGGLLASLIDCHAMATAAAQTERNAGLVVGAQPAARYVTAALHVDFLRPTPLGVELVLRARVTETGRRKIVVAVSLTAADIETVRGQVVAVPMPVTMETKAAGGSPPSSS